MTITIVHVAGEPEERLQSCSRCGEVLINVTGAMSTDGAARAWAVGSFVGKIGNSTILMMRDADSESNALRCDHIPF